MTGKIPMTIEWRHLEVGGVTCNRCSDTGKNLGRVIGRLRSEGMLDHVDLILTETLLSPDDFARSNTVIVNGVPVDEMRGASITFTECSSSSDLPGESACCRSVVSGQRVLDAIPEEMLRAANLKFLGLERSGTA